MLKHVQISPLRNRSDSMSIRSTTSCSSSLCGSPEPSEHTRTPSRASSYSSLSDTIPQTTIKIYTACLRVDIEYKTLGISWDTTSREVVASVLRRCKQRHRDPRLFYLSMEVTVRRVGVRRVIVLDDETRPAVLQACHPKGDSRFCLQLRPGGLVRVHTSALQPMSLYKSLFISEETSSDELLGLLLSCYNSVEPIEQFSLYEVCPGQEYQRKLHPDDHPLRAQVQRQQRGEISHFLVRRNPNYPRRKQLLPSISEKHSSSTNSVQSITSSSDGLTKCTEELCKLCSCNNHELDKTNNTNKETIEMIKKNDICNKCKNNFKSCDFCMKNVNSNNNNNSNNISNNNNNNNSINGIKLSDRIKNNTPTSTYNPVYNIREIRTVCHTFSAFGIDKKLMEVERNSNLKINKNNRHSFCSNNNYTKTEELSHNSSKGFGNFVYI